MANWHSVTGQCTREVLDAVALDGANGARKWPARGESWEAVLHGNDLRYYKVPLLYGRTRPTAR